MNRDDLITRPEGPPTDQTTDGIRFVSPVDLQSGGTWIGLNEAGLTACLLNRYDTALPSYKVSRGAIVPCAMACRTPSEAIQRIAALDLNQFAPFTCVIVSLDTQVRLDWTGSEIVSSEPVKGCETKKSCMTTSSSVLAADVSARRYRLFQSLTQDRGHDLETLAQFHTSSNHEDSWWTPWMARETAHTKSVTRLELSDGRLRLRYWDRSTVEQSGLDPQSQFVFDV